MKKLPISALLLLAISILLLMFVSCTDEIKTNSPPTFSLRATTYDAPQTLVIDGIDGAAFYYTIDGSIPTSTPTDTCKLYSQALVINENTTVKALAVHADFPDSTVTSAEYKIRAGSPQFSLDSETLYASAQDLILTSATEGASIFYTRDGSDPKESGISYTAGTILNITETTTVKAFSRKATMEDSSVLAKSYLFPTNAAAPVITPDAGSYATALSVSLSTAGGGEIRYTLDGTTPTKDSTKYVAPFLVSSNMTVQAITIQQGYFPSEVASTSYSFLLSIEKPEISIKTGTYASAQNVTITTADGASIYYTTDTTDPRTSDTIITYSGPFAISKNTVVNAVSKKDAYGDSPLAVETIQIQVASPIFSIAPNTYVTPQLLSISGIAGATIYYTLDGSIPTATLSAVYSEPILIGVNTSVQAIAVHADYADSTVTVADYKIRAEKPQFSLDADVPHTSPQTLTLTTTDQDVIILYTIDGRDPKEFGIPYNATTKINLIKSSIVKAISIQAAMEYSMVVTKSYTFLPIAQPPVISPESGFFANVSPLEISIIAGTEGSTIYYTTDGTNPSTSSSRKAYSMPFTVSTDVTVQAITAKEAYFDSAVSSNSYQFIPLTAMPVISPSSGTYASTQNVSITTSTADAQIFYTVDGTTPTLASTVYATPLEIPVNTTVKAFAIKNGYIDSSVAEANIQIRVASPIFSLTASTYDSPQELLISGMTGASTYYTLDGSEPTSTQTETCKLYTQALTISLNTTVKALAVHVGYADSTVKIATYNIRLAAPTFSQEAGTYADPINITLSSIATDAVIYYTTDGTYPTSLSTEYSGPIPVRQSTTIRSRSTKSGMTDSAVITKKYTITNPIYEVGDNGPAGGKIFYTKASFSDGWQYMEVAPNDIDSISYFGYYRTTSSGDSKLVGTEAGIGSGKANTAKLVFAMGDEAYISDVTTTTTTSELYAAKQCNDYVFGGKDDWFLPSKDELSMIHTNYGTVNPGYFSYNSWYWSSTEDGPYDAFRQSHSGGVANYERRSKGGVSRPIRAF